MTESAGVASHLGIRLDEYDARIRTFVPYYEEMLGEIERLVALLAPDDPAILDLGIGTGALAQRCLAARPSAHIVGIDADPGMLEAARARLHGHDPELHHASFLDLELPAADVIVSSIALHHVRTPAAKQRLYARCRMALRDGGAMLLADCYLPRTAALAAEGMQAWRRHLERHYPAAEAAGYLDAWAGEDVYFALEDELDWLRAAGFAAEVVWRRELFAVVYSS